jgi:hypothetical protein
VSGGVAERLMAPVLKTGGAQALAGSNPAPSARYHDFSPLSDGNSDNPLNYPLQIARMQANGGGSQMGAVRPHEAFDRDVAATPQSRDPRWQRSGNWISGTPP